MRATLRNQIAWVQGKAAQQRRLVARARPGSRQADHALRHQQMAEAVARSLEAYAADPLRAGSKGRSLLTAERP